MTTAMSFDGVSKRFRGTRHYAALREDISAGLRRMMGMGRVPAPDVVALDDVSFDVEEGEAFALIGDNGAGKTTALKLSTRITYPTSGTVTIRGRVGALIEVGTGMHPELNGRENIQLFGRILGLPGATIDRRFDDIVGFAEIGPALDQPVKQYSTGMQLRLGFSIASHLEPDILLVDEAIAVGDAGFQHRCMERMSELTREGRTLVFVSHDMKAVETLCTRAIRLDHGTIVDDGPARDVVRRYLQEVQERRLVSAGHVIEGRDLDIIGVTLLDENGESLTEVDTGAPLTVRLHYRAKRPIREPLFCVALGEGGACFAQAATVVDADAPAVIDGEGYSECTFLELPLRPRVYEVWGGIAGELGGNLVDWQRLATFRVRSEFGPGKAAVSTMLSEAPVQLPYRWMHHVGGPGGSADAKVSVIREGRRARSVDG